MPSREIHPYKEQYECFIKEGPRLQVSSRWHMDGFTVRDTLLQLDSIPIVMSGKSKKKKTAFYRLIRTD